MPYKLPTHGYDPLFNYTEKELVDMYVAEGKSLAYAKKQAPIIKKAIQNMNFSEQQLWKKVRKHEIPQGLLLDE